MKYVLIHKFCADTGCTEKSVRRKIEEGVWLERQQYRRAPDGRIWIDLAGVEKWVEGQQGPLNRSGPRSGSSSRGAANAA